VTTVGLLHIGIVSIRGYRIGRNDGGYGRLVKIGFGLPVSGSWATPENILHVARRAEELGYHSLWTFQRLLSPVDGEWGEMYRSVQDPLITLGYAAAVTSRVRLGVAIINLPYVSPILLSKQATTLDILSGGRLDLGLGLGWSELEFVASGVDMQRRGRRAEEYIAALRALWTDDVVEHEGEFYRIPRSRVEPKPVQRPYPPILLGGTAAVALRRAGRISDGWISSSRANLATIGESVTLIKQAAAEAGRDPEALRFICRGSVKVRDDAVRDEAVRDEVVAERARLTGSLADIRTDLADLAEQGITEVFIDLNFDPRIGSPDADPAESRQRADETLKALAP
jgi:probable F420-dependent oxidoreductase